MNFIAIDFETANSNRASACEIGLVKVVDSSIVEEKSYLIRPMDNYFDWFNTELHGIDELMVKDVPEFDEIFGLIKTDFEEFPLIAHNAAFDIGVLRRTLDLYHIEYPETRYSCTYQMSRLHIPSLFSFRLDAICDYYKIPLEHHRALSDARACAQVALRIFNDLGVNELEEIEKALNLRIGKLYKDGYNASSKMQHSKSYILSHLEVDKSHFDEGNVFYNSSVCFTGTLKSMIRSEAQKIVLEIGGNVTNGVTKETNYLIVGDQDYHKFGNGFKSSKIKKAELHLKEGHKIELISERQFLQMVHN